MKKTLTTLALAASMAVASPVYAQNQQDQQNQQGVRAVFGTVVETKDIQLEGMQNKHTFIKVENQQGKQIVIDAGAKANAKKLKKGDKVAAVGKAARISGKPVLFAKYFGELDNAGRTGMNKNQKNN